MATLRKCTFHQLWRYVPKSLVLNHSGQRLAAVSGEIVAEVNRRIAGSVDMKKCASFCVDGGSNMVSMLEALRVSDKRIKCLGHEVNSALKDWVSQCPPVNKLFFIVKCLVGCALRSHYVACHELKEGRLHSFCQTRFYIYGLMAESVLKNQAMFENLKTWQVDNKTVDKITVLWNQIEVIRLRSVVDLLKSVIQIFTLLGGNGPVAGLTIELYKDFLRSISVWKTTWSAKGLNEDMLSAGDALHGCVARRLGWVPSHLSLRKAAALDLRAKGLICVEGLAPLRDVGVLREEMEELLKTGAFPQKFEKVAVSEAPQEASPDSELSLMQRLAREPPSSAARSSAAEEALEEPSVEFAVTDERRVEAELAFLKSAPRLEASGNPFAFFNKHCGEIPVLTELARKYLGMPVMQLQSERLFSVAGGVMTAKRSKLKETKFEKLVAAKVNQRSLFQANVCQRLVDALETTDANAHADGMEKVASKRKAAT